MVWMLSGSVMSDITRSVPPHKGQTEISISNTRFKRSAQVSGAVTESCSIGEWAGLGVAVCVRFLRAGLAGPGTTAFAYRKFKPPFRAAAVPSRIRQRLGSVVDLTCQWPLSDVPAYGSRTKAIPLRGHAEQR